MSVSNYINGRLHLMRDSTRDRIKEAIATLEYRPSSQARGFRQGKDFSVGMIVIDPSPNFLVEPFIGQVVSGLSTKLAAEGYACLLQGIRSCRAEGVDAQNFARSDALCLFPSGPRAARWKLCADLAALRIPIVLIEDHEPPPGLDIAVVRQDDAAGARALIEHLRACQARSFLYVTPKPTWPSNVAREAAFRARLDELGQDIRFEKLTCGFGNFRDVQNAVEQWLDGGGRCDAILGNNDHIGIAVLKTLSARGVQVPDEILVTGFGAFELWNYSSPLLTTISSPAYELGRQAARALLERLGEGKFASANGSFPSHSNSARPPPPSRPAERAI